MCEPDATLREAARRMSQSGNDAALIRLDEDGVGILTDRDLRTVVADGVAAEATVTEAMSAPAFTVTPERFGGEVMLEMLKRGIRHVPVVSPSAKCVGVLSDVDLLAAQTATPFALRRAIDEARDVEEVREAAARLPSPGRLPARRAGRARPRSARSSRSSPMRARAGSSS